jgi:hypothetical protein
MITVKTIKFDLPIDGIKVKTFDEFKSHFTTEVIDLYKNGLLSRWLQSQGMDEYAQSLRNLLPQPNDALLLSSLCEIFDVVIDDQALLSQLADYHASGIKIDPEQLRYKRKYEALVNESKPKGKIAGFDNEFVGSSVTTDLLVKAHKHHTGEDIILVPVIGVFSRNFDGIFEINSDNFNAAYMVNKGDFINFDQPIFSLYFSAEQVIQKNHSDSWGWQQKQQILQEWNRQQVQYQNGTLQKTTSPTISSHIYAPCEGILYKKVKPNSNNNRSVCIKDYIEEHTIAYLRVDM